MKVHDRLAGGCTVIHTNVVAVRSTLSIKVHLCDFKQFKDSQPLLHCEVKQRRNVSARNYQTVTLGQRKTIASDYRKVAGMHELLIRMLAKDATILTAIGHYYPLFNSQLPEDSAGVSCAESAARTCTGREQAKYGPPCSRRRIGKHSSLLGRRRSFILMPSSRRPGDLMIEYSSGIPYELGEPVCSVDAGRRWCDSLCRCRKINEETEARP